MSSQSSAAQAPIRREPPRFRRVIVSRCEPLTPRMTRVVLTGTELDGLVIDRPAASVRLLLPRADGRLELPTWTGNQFELADGSRAPIRTFTPRNHDPEADELTIDVVAHGDGAASGWAASATPGDEVAVSGPGRGYDIDVNAGSYLLVGDETAIPAIAQLLEAMPDDLSTIVLIEVTDPEARLELPAGPETMITWLDLPDGSVPGAAMVEAVEQLVTMPEAVWVAGEAAAMQRIRTHLFEQRGLTRSQATVRGYWKLGRSAT